MTMPGNLPRSPRFEAFFAHHISGPLAYVQAMWDDDAGTYRSRSYHVEIAWAAWCEALRPML